MFGNLAKNERIRDLMVENRVVLEQAVEGVPGKTGRSAIVSRVPDVKIDCPTGKLETSESTLRLEDADGSVTFRVRLCKGARATMDPESVVAWAVDEKGRKYPASAVDLESRTIMLPMDLDHVEIVQAGAETDLVEYMTKRLVETPLKSILATDGPPLIGPDVRDGIQSLFPVGRMRDEESYLKKELVFLERLRPTMSRFTQRFSKRVKEINKRLEVLKTRKEPPGLPEEVVMRQLSMLSRVVSQRACSWLQFDTNGITGGVNPGPEAGQRGRGAVEFKIYNPPHDFRPEVLVWNRTGRYRNRPRCLGSGMEILVHFQKDRDPYGMIDTVLNYIETNKVGVHRRRPVPMPAVLEDFVDDGRDYLEDLF